MSKFSPSVELITLLKDEEESTNAVALSRVSQNSRDLQEHRVFPGSASVSH